MVCADNFPRRVDAKLDYSSASSRPVVVPEEEAFARRDVSLILGPPPPVFLQVRELGRDGVFSQR